MNPTLMCEFEQITLAVNSNDDESVAKIDNSLKTISQERDPECVEFLLRSLDDKFQFPEGMFSIIHTAEIFDDRSYVSGFLNAMPHVVDSAPRWASIVFMRIVNSEQAKRELIKFLTGSNVAIKRSVEELCNMINIQSTDFLTKTVAVLVAIR